MWLVFSTVADASNSVHMSLWCCESWCGLDTNMIPLRRVLETSENKLYREPSQVGEFSYNFQCSVYGRSYFGHWILPRLSFGCVSCPLRYLDPFYRSLYSRH